MSAAITDRKAMLRDSIADVALTQDATGKASFDERFIAAMANLPHESFVGTCDRYNAFFNRPLPIGDGQTISQPDIVALLSDLLATGPDSIVLDAGIGSGYQSAVLAKLARQVQRREFSSALTSAAEARLQGPGYANVTVRQNDGSQGWCAQGPFDGIIVTAAAPHIPPSLVQQVKPKGRLVLSDGLRVVRDGPRTRLDRHRESGSPG